MTPPRRPHVNTPLFALGPLVTLGASLALSACTQKAPVVAPDARIALTVGALDLPGVGAADYTITVTNEDGALVWRRSLDTDRFGRDGSLTYVGPCDASASPNTVTLELDALRDASGQALDPATWVDPGPLARAFSCAPNTDTAVEFDLVIARRAEQGFFDIGVDFEDVFCSAKLDCVPELLHQPGGARDTTAIVAFACTSGADQPTWLHHRPPEIVCPGRTIPIVAIGPPGNHGSPAPGVFEVASYRAKESLAPYDKCFWNTAIGLDVAALGPDCRLEATATASTGPLKDGLTPANAVFPILTWSVQLTDEAGALACSASALDAPGSGVATRYTSASAPAAFPFSMACSDAPTVIPAGTACAGTVASTDARAVMTHTANGLVVTFDGETSPPYALPPELALGGCCVDPCCTEESP